ncbi:Dnaj-like protein subfamily c member 1 [Plakobranchus ocellatus]|uniref:Dnaj-like protein subfamily c member 1 n=1 Tax=Plakobranchus ocellatus TaxID=259542 RepID=A0AAV3Z8C1_9GAST|nr:Dnaj-like protein subfamily c member 1 [Plakobranchus ocellatus]
MAAFMLLKIILMSTLLVSCIGWDTDDLEIFDLVEEVNANFYEVFGISQSASSSEIRKAYRKLSLVTHPDKNEAEDAAEKFRQIVAIYEVLKDAKKREKYNQVLIDGLPDWRQPVFYYRRARKMGFAELFIVLFIILTVGHYFVAWGFYIERRLVVEEVLSSKKRKRKKKQAGSDPAAEDEEELQKIPIPRILDLWPFQLSIFIFHTVYSLPETIRTWQEERKRRKEEEEEELAEMKLLEEEVQGSDFKSRSAAIRISDNIISQQEPDSANDDGESLLNAGQVRKRHKPTKIPHSVDRTLMISKGAEKSSAKSKTEIAGDSSITAGPNANTNGPQLPPDRFGSTKTNKNVAEAETSDGTRKPREPWTQNQQTIFEWALKQYPKGTEARWEKVAEHIPGKSKEDCIVWFKELALSISQRKKKDQQQQQQQVSSGQPR